MNKKDVQKLVLTALLLGLAIAAQQLRFLHPQFITGPLINAVLIAAAIWGGLKSGLTIAIISPLLAILTAPNPYIAGFLYLIPMIALGNAALVVCAYAFRNKNLATFGVGLVIGSALKAAILWVGVIHLLVPFFGQGLPEMIRNVVFPGMFSWSQLLTALAGSIIILLIRPRIDKAIEKGN